VRELVGQPGALQAGQPGGRHLDERDDVGADPAQQRRRGGGVRPAVPGVDGEDDDLVALRRRPALVGRDRPPGRQREDDVDGQQRPGEDGEEPGARDEADGQRPGRGRADERDERLGADDERRPAAVVVDVPPPGGGEQGAEDDEDDQDDEGRGHGQRPSPSPTGALAGSSGQARPRATPRPVPVL
jgi:hypothetical protein